MITRRLDGHHHLVELAGELDLASSDALRGELDAAAVGGAELTVDLQRLRFVDSTGLAVLFDAFQRADAEDRRIAFTNPCPEVERTLRLTGLDRILPLGPPPELVDADEGGR
jgi:anti-anti-sigma factor